MSRPFAVLFPGQGAQEVGMGRDLLRQDGTARALMQTASEAAGEDLERLCLRGPDRMLAETRFLQPALTAVCLGLWRRFHVSGLRPAATAGHSVGELSAMAASGAATPEDAVRIAALRGRLMHEAAAASPGAMVAASGLSFEAAAAAIAAQSAEDGVLAIAAVNAPSQITVSGDKDRVEAFAASVVSPAVRTTMLRVSGAWHSPHMVPAVPELAETFGALALSPPQMPMVLNEEGRSTSDSETIRASLPGRLVSPVRWDRVMHTLLVDLGIRDFVEVGPGKVLRGLVRLNDDAPDITVHNISDLRGLERTISALSAA